MPIYFLRHGQSQSNADRTLAGQLDSPLTDLGREQASQEALRLQQQAKRFDVIVTSPLSRAYDTAISVAEATGYPVDDIVVSNLAIERYLGQLQGQSAEGLSQLETSDGGESLGVEPLQSLANRSQQLLDELERDYPGREILVVSHAGTGEMMRTIIEQTDISQVRLGQNIPNAETIQL